MRHELNRRDAGKWNANIHYHDVVLDNLPYQRSTALDVGCGEGILTRQLGSKFDRVVGVDVHAESIAAARQLTEADNVRYVVADFMTMDIEADHYDLVTSVVALHHMEVESALERMRRATRPGGRIVVVGLSAPSYRRDVPRLGVAFITNNIQRIRGRKYIHSAPMIWPPPLTSTEMQDLVKRVLPGARYRRHWLNRDTIVWQKP